MTDGSELYVSNAAKVNKVRDKKALHVDEAQSLTDAEKAQARTNIGAGTPITVDSELSLTSENPVTNKATTEGLRDKIDVFQGNGEKGKVMKVNDEGYLLPTEISTVPSGGYTGQSLVKKSNDDGDLEWGGDGLEYDTVINIPTHIQNGKTYHINIAVDKDPPFSGNLTQINEGAELVPAVNYSDGYALGWSCSLISIMVDTKSIDMVFTYVEQIRENCEFLISGGYITSPIALRISKGEFWGTSSYDPNNDPIQKGLRLYYYKSSTGCNLYLYSNNAYRKFYYYSDESKIPDSYKNSYRVSGNWILADNFSENGETNSPKPLSYAGYLLGVNSKGMPTYTSPTDLNLLQFTEQTLTSDQQAQARANIGVDTSTFMEKENPVGTGSLSINRKADTTIGSKSVALGNNCTASMDYSFAVGNECVASQVGSFAQGNSCESSGFFSFAEGSGNKATGFCSHAEGNSTKATSYQCHAEGSGSEASAFDSHAEGSYTKTNAATNAQHVQGKYNIVTADMAHIVGNGESDSARSNAHTLDFSGNAWYAGDVYVGSTSGTNKDAGSVKLAREDKVVSLEEQTLTDAQKTQVRTNLGISVVSETDISTALGYVPRKAWYVNITGTYLPLSLTSDKTPAEIYQAYNEGYAIYAKGTIPQIDSRPFIVPLITAVFQDDSYILQFGTTLKTSSSNMTIQLSFTYSDQWYFLFEPLVSEDIMNVQLMGKVNIDQGSSYTGQYLGINSNGQVEPMDINFTWSEF